MKADPRPLRLDGARLPRWSLPPGWPVDAGGAPMLARLRLAGGRIAAIEPVTPSDGEPTDAERRERIDLGGAPVLPGLLDAHLHLDKTFTIARIGAVEPGLLGAIDAMLLDRARWTPADVRERAARGLAWAHAAGATRVRTHVDWWEADATPVACPVLAELAAEWHGRLQIEQVALIKLPLFEDAATARRLARAVAGPTAGDRAAASTRAAPRATAGTSTHDPAGLRPLLGGFVHSTNWSEPALRHLLEAAQAEGLDVDLHVDEELNADAVGLEHVARIAREIGFAGRIVCGHVCALAAQPEARALATLDAVARAPITLVSLPATNLLLQDAVTGRTPRRRGLTLVKEARERGIPLLFASDNVQDPFCRGGSYDPVEALGLAALVAQLDEPFDRWSDTICRADWLAAGAGSTPFELVGAPADLVVFPDADVHAFPSRTARRTVLRGGRVLGGANA